MIPEFDENDKAEVLKSCPSCGHNFEACKQGINERIAKGERRCVCTGCGKEFFEAEMEKCNRYLRCTRIYCRNCSPKNLNQGFCKESLGNRNNCSGCRQSFNSFRLTFCRNPDCSCQFEEDFCPDCAPRLLDDRGWCSHCLNEVIWECSFCRQRFLQSKLMKCAEKSCLRNSCKKCNKLDSQGYCTETPPTKYHAGDSRGCNYVACAGCNRKYERGKREFVSCNSCSRRYCEARQCSKHFLRMEKCVHCLPRDVDYCTGCSKTVFHSDLYTCQLCQQGVCSQCRNQYCNTCARYLCRFCVSQCAKCEKYFCRADLKMGRCKNCRGWLSKILP